MNFSRHLRPYTSLEWLPPPVRFNFYRPHDVTWASEFGSSLRSAYPHRIVVTSRDVVTVHPKAKQWGRGVTKPAWNKTSRYREGSCSLFLCKQNLKGQCKCNIDIFEYEQKIFRAADMLLHCTSNKKVS